MLKGNVGGGSEVKMTHYTYTKTTRGTKLKVKADKQAKMQQTDELVQCLRYNIIVKQGSYLKVIFVRYYYCILYCLSSISCVLFLISGVIQSGSVYLCCILSCLFYFSCHSFCLTQHSFRFNSELMMTYLACPSFFVFIRTDNSVVCFDWLLFDYSKNKNEANTQNNNHNS